MPETATEFVDAVAALLVEFARNHGTSNGLGQREISGVASVILEAVDDAVDELAPGDNDEKLRLANHIHYALYCASRNGLITQQRIAEARADEGAAIHGVRGLEQADAAAARDRGE